MVALAEILPGRSRELPLSPLCHGSDLGQKFRHQLPHLPDSPLQLPVCQRRLWGGVEQKQLSLSCVCTAEGIGGPSGGKRANPLRAIPGQVQITGHRSVDLQLGQIVGRHGIDGRDPSQHDIDRRLWQIF